MSAPQIGRCDFCGAPLPLDVPAVEIDGELGCPPKHGCSTGCDSCRGEGPHGAGTVGKDAHGDSCSWHCHACEVRP